MNSTFVKIDDKYEEKSEVKPGTDGFTTLKQLWFARNNNGKCVWTLAVTSNNVRMVEMMLKQGVSADTEIMIEPNFPLGYAATAGHIEMFRLLLKHGADIEITDNFGNNIFHIIAISKRFNEFLDALQESAQYHGLISK